MKLEKDLFSSYWNDGLADILFGFAVLSAGIGWRIIGPLAVIQMPLWIAIWHPLRRNLVEPHVGFVRFSIAREAGNKRKLKTIFAFGVGLLTLITVSACFISTASIGDDSSNWIGAFPSGLIALAMVLAFWLLSVTRLIFYAAAILIAGVASVMLNEGPGIALIIGSVVPLLMGLLLWRRFLMESRKFSASQ
jgi:hypothetical protein